MKEVISGSKNSQLALFTLIPTDDLIKDSKFDDQDQIPAHVLPYAKVRCAHALTTRKLSVVCTQTFYRLTERVKDLNKTYTNLTQVSFLQRNAES